MHLEAMTHAGRFERLPLFTLCAVVSTLVGCGGSNGVSNDGGEDTGGDAGGDGGVPLSPADQAFLADFCAAVVPCCTANGRTADPTVCQQSLAKVGWTRDPQVRAACLDQLHQLAT